jgi:hypothetical protein
MEELTPQAWLDKYDTPIYRVTRRGFQQLRKALKGEKWTTGEPIETGQDPWDDPVTAKDEHCFLFYSDEDKAYWFSSPGHIKGQDHVNLFTPMPVKWLMPKPPRIGEMEF